MKKVVYNLKPLNKSQNMTDVDFCEMSEGQYFLGILHMQRSDWTSPH